MANAAERLVVEEFLCSANQSFAMYQGLTNGAVSAMMAKASIGFGRDKREGEDQAEIERLFAPEFRNRLDAVIPFSNLPPEIVARLNTEINKLFKDPGFLEVIRASGGDPLGGTAAQFEARMRRDEARLSEVIRISGAKAN